MLVGGVEEGAALWPSLPDSVNLALREELSCSQAGEGMRAWGRRLWASCRPHVGQQPGGGDSELQHGQGAGLASRAVPHFLWKHQFSLPKDRT